MTAIPGDTNEPETVAPPETAMAEPVAAETTAPPEAASPEAAPREPDASKSAGAPADADPVPIDELPEAPAPEAPAKLPIPDTIEPKLVVEALLFAAPEPVDEATVQRHLGARARAGDVLAELRLDYLGRGVRLEQQGRRWAFRTAPEVAPYLVRVERPSRRLSKAAMETLAIIAYQQPVTRAEIEAVRGVAVSSGTLDALVEAGWVVPKGRREVPGRPVTWVTTPAFLDHFGIASLADLPRLEELESAGLFKAGSDG